MEKIGRPRASLIQRMLWRAGEGALFQAKVQSLKKLWRGGLAKGDVEEETEFLKVWLLDQQHHLGTLQ